MRFLALLFVLLPFLSAVDDVPRIRTLAQNCENDGNFKEALALWKTTLEHPKAGGSITGENLRHAVICLGRLNQIQEFDSLLESCVSRHAKDWRVLFEISRQYLNAHHYGCMIAGKFERGEHRGGGQGVQPILRDRARSLQILSQALTLALSDDGKAEVARFCLSAADMLNQNTSAFFMQRKSDLSTLPDWEDPAPGDSQLAPSSADGKPIFFAVPSSWETAQSDGERWRWLLHQAVVLDPNRARDSDLARANWAQRWFDVQTLHNGPASTLFTKDRDGPWSLFTLKEDETIARLASGIKRFTLPADYAFLPIFQQYGCWSDAAQSLENRTQYPAAAACWEKFQVTDRINQIRGNWGVFIDSKPQVAGQKATLPFRFRNGTKATFTAWKVLDDKLRSDIKDLIRKRPSKLDNWQETDPGALAWRLMEQNQSQYRGEQVAQWHQSLEPAKNHFNTIISLETPLSQAGCYLLESQMEGGNANRILLWISDAILVKKKTDNGPCYFLADAQSGAAIPNANVSFFAWTAEHKDNNTLNITVHESAETSDSNGFAFIRDTKLWNLQILAEASAPDGRRAWQGFEFSYSPQRYHTIYDQSKAYLITDRPVYRPGDKMQGKGWIRQAKFDLVGTGPWANKNLTLILVDPKGTEVWKRPFLTDNNAGAEFSWDIPLETTLGSYFLQIRDNNRHFGTLSFRVEEYKKPEFEVSVLAPTQPLSLGGLISATISAQYFFGAPVTNASVTVKVLRTEHDGSWYPCYRWDWLYGPGYWWFFDEYHWYPSWQRWGCPKPQPAWWWRGWRQQDPPELVLEKTCPIGPDGSLRIDIDTNSAKALFGDRSHRYQISAEVTDQSRRTIVGSGSVLAANVPFKVLVWTDHGYLHQGDPMNVNLAARSPDGKPIKGQATLSLLRLQYDAERQPKTHVIASVELNLDAEGQASHRFVAKDAGQYRLKTEVVDTQGNTQEGGNLLTVLGSGTKPSDYRYNALELTTDKKEYAPGDTAKLLICADQPDANVLVFLRPVNGAYPPPILQKLSGRNGILELPITSGDQPNCFVEVLSVAAGQVHSVVREIIVPPASRMLTVDLIPAAKTCKPGQKTSFSVQVRDEQGQPVMGDAALSIYDKAVEYISGGSNIPDIQAHFWKWRRYHSPQTTNSLRNGWALWKYGETRMYFLGIFGQEVEVLGRDGVFGGHRGAVRTRAAGRMGSPNASESIIAGGSESSAAMTGMSLKAVPMEMDSLRPTTPAADNNNPAFTVRKNFADTALWRGTIKLDANGQASIECPLPESLTTWKARLWVISEGTRVGEATTEIITNKDLMVRIQAPRFFVERDEVVISAILNSKIPKAQSVASSLEFEGGLKLLGPAEKAVELAATGELRLDWRVKVLTEGSALLRVKALAAVDSDAMELRLPIKVHGMVKMLSVSRSLRPEESSNSFTLEVPKERRPEQTRLELRWSPTLAGAMMDALPYLVSYPYGCTEQTLNRFLPTVVIQKLLTDQGIDLEKLSEKHTNFNAQEIGDPAKRAAQWKIWHDSNPIYDPAKVRLMVKEGISHLAGMQCSDGGWGWNSGYGEHSYPHTTAVVVHGLTIAKASKVALPAGLLERGVAWLEREQEAQITIITLGRQTKKHKWHADAQDAFTAMVLAENGKKDDRMLKFLDEDRTHLSVYGVAMYGLTMHHLKDKDGVARALRNVEQYLKQDEENQTAWLELGNTGYWWYWYGSENETLAIYLKLLAATDPKGKVAPRLVKYLLNNRKHGARWDSTRDTAMCIESLGDYLRASGEIAPDLTVTASVDGKKWKEVKITKENLLTFDGTLILEGALLGAGKHTVELSKTGSGPLYANAYLSFFTLEDKITAAGLEVKVERKLSRLEKVDLKTVAAGNHGQVVEYATEKYRRVPLPDGAKVKSGDLIEVELIVESKNDYEYICLEDYKPAGCESADLQSGYVTGTGIHAYRELRDDRVAHLIHRLPRGKHNIIHRLRAEIPGTFGVLPTKIYGMYAPELAGNSDSQKLGIEEK